MQRPEKPKQGQRWISGLKQPTLFSKRPAHKIGSKVKKTNFLRQILTQISKKCLLFWNKGGTINFHITYPPGSPTIDLKPM